MDTQKMEQLERGLADLGAALNRFADEADAMADRLARENPAAVVATDAKFEAALAAVREREHFVARLVTERLGSEIAVTDTPVRPAR